MVTPASRHPLTSPVSPSRSNDDLVNRALREAIEKVVPTQAEVSTPGAGGRTERKSSSIRPPRANCSSSGHEDAP